MHEYNSCRHRLKSSREENLSPKRQRPLAAKNGRFLPVFAAPAMLLVGLFVLPASSAAQDWFRTGTGLGVAKPRVAVADFASRSASTPSLATLFSDVVRNDLDFSGILDLASKSFYPSQVPSAPAELSYPAW